MPAGYSKTPLARKLGIKEGDSVALVAAPRGYELLLGRLPERTKLTRKLKEGLDVVQVFATESSALAAVFPELMASVKPAGAVWVSWPKKSSGVPTDLSDVAVRKIGLSHGLVDVKVCAVDEVWSGLKFVRRAESR